MIGPATIRPVRVVTSARRDKPIAAALKSNAAPA